MESLDKLPTPENLDEVAKNDVLDRNVFIANFIRLLASIEGHYSIALDGRWGSGKTFFVKQTERVIRQLFRNKKEFNEYYVVESNTNLCVIFKNLFDNDEIKAHPMMTFYYDAWQHDNQQDALLSLVFELVKILPSNDPRLKAEHTTLDNIQKTIVPIVQAILKHVIGLDLKSLSEEFNKNPEDVLQKTRNQENLDQLLNIFFETLLPNKESRLVIFIDELDRCRPDYAVQLLERIKHYMLSNQITFVFTINTEQLQHTIKHYYGEEFEASSYLDKFFDLHVILPVPDAIKRKESFSIGMYGSVFDQWCQILIDEYKFELREQIHFKESIEQSIHISDDNFMCNSHSYFDEVNALKFLLTFFAPLAIALKIKNINDYYLFIDGKNMKSLDILKNNLSEMPTDYFCKKFDIDTSLGKNDQIKKIKSSLDELYEKVFKHSYYFSGNTIKLNKFEINYMIKDAFINQISHLSR